MMKDKKAENKPGLPWDILSPDAEADEKFISLVHEESRAVREEQMPPVFAGKGKGRSEK